MHGKSEHNSDQRHDRFIIRTVHTATIPQSPEDVQDKNAENLFTEHQHSAGELSESAEQKREERIKKKTKKSGKKRKISPSTKTSSSSSSSPVSSNDESKKEETSNKKHIPDNGIKEKILIE